MRAINLFVIAITSSRQARGMGILVLNGLTGEWHACFLFVSGSTRGETGISVVLAEPTRNAEDEIAEYLERDQHDLPPALRIELERRSMSP